MNRARLERSVRRLGAFTLVEVLMAVLILGIGLLGLGAILPVVVNQQRQSSEKTFATLAQSSVEGYLFTDRVGSDARFRYSFNVELDANGNVPADQELRLRIGNQQVVVSLPTTIGAIQSAVSQVPVLAGVQVSGTDPVTNTSQNRQEYVFEVTFSGALGQAAVALNEVSMTGTSSVRSAEIVRVNAGAPSVGAGFWTNWASQTAGPSGDLIPGATNPDDIGLWLIPQTSSAERGAIQFGARQPSSATVPVVLDRRVVAPLLDRLHPTVESGMASPQFVWDVAVRRVSRDNPRGVQIATFLRRVDPKTRVDAGQSLWMAYGSTRANETERRWPVSVDLRGRATFDGRFQGGAYSSPIATPVIFREVTVENRRVRDRLQIESSPAPLRVVPDDVSMDASELFAAASQPGQQLVDNLGNVYTVIGVDDRDRQSATNRWLRITPPVPAGVPDTQTTENRSVRQVLFTPQVPARVFLTTVNP